MCRLSSALIRLQSSQLLFCCGRVVSVPDSGSEEHGFESQSRRCRVLLGKLLTPIVPRSTQPCIPSGSLNRVSASAGVKAGKSPLGGLSLHFCPGAPEFQVTKLRHCSRVLGCFERKLKTVLFKQHSCTQWCSRVQYIRIQVWVHRLSVNVKVQFE